MKSTTTYLQHLAALRRAAAVVMSDPRHYFVDAGVMSLARRGDFRIFAGVLVELWSETNAQERDTCLPPAGVVHSTGSRA